jgi:hypothetical protein
VNTYTLNISQAYNYYRFVINRTIGSAASADFGEWTLNGAEESLCITSDAKVGVGIANPQRALEVAGDLVVGGTLSAGNPLMYRNRIINGDMRIAQIGTSVTTTTSTATVYLVDRFHVSVPDAAIVSFTTIQNTLSGSDTPYQLGFRNSLRLTTNIGLDPTTFTTGFPRIIQYIDGYNAADFNWGTSFGVPVTLGFWFRTNVSSGSVFNIRITNAAVTYHFITIFTYSGGWQYVTLTIPPPPNGSVWATTTNASMTVCIAEVGTGNGTNITPVINAWTSTANARTSSGCTNWVQAPGNYIELTGVQLEKGTVATPFEFRPYATELALCQTWNNMSSVTGSTSLCLNTAGGNVGIGTKNPGYTLDVNGTIRTVAPILVDSSAAGANYSVLRVTTGGDGNNYIQSAAAQTAGSRANLIFSGWFGDSESMRLTSTGRLSIGTTSPQRLLDVNGSIRGGSYEGKEFNGGYISLNSYYDGGWLKWTTSGGGFIIRGDNTLDSTLGGTTFITQTTASTATTTRLTILHGSGNVGIGTTTPAVPIDTVGSTTLNSITNTIAQFRAATTLGTNDAGVVIGSTNGNTPFIGDNASSASLGLSLQTNRTTRIRIDTVGNVGIGTTSPSALLHSIVNTTANIPDAIIGNHVIKSYNRTLAVAATSFSNICTITATNGSVVVYLDVVQSESGAGSTASYVVPMAYNSTGNAWRLLLAISISNQNAPNYAQVLFKQTNNEATFALYRPSVASTGTANFTCTFRISQSQVNTATFADKTDTTTLAAVTTIYSYTQLTQTTTGVGIGTASPSSLLDFNTSSSINKVISFWQQSAADPATATNFTGFGVATNVLRYQSSSAFGGGHQWYMGATEAMRLGVNAGNICLGIGKTPGNYQIDLSTDTARKLTTSTWATGSDERIKTDIQSANLHTCYETIKTIDLKYFRWNFPIESNVSVDDTHSLGFIAQDVKAVFPNAVFESNSYGFTDFLSLNTDQILKAMYGALRQTMADKEVLEENVNSQAATIGSLETKIDLLESQNTALKDRLDSLEARLAAAGTDK